MQLMDQLISEVHLGTIDGESNAGLPHAPTFLLYSLCLPAPSTAHFSYLWNQRVCFHPSVMLNKRKRSIWRTVTTPYKFDKALLASFVLRNEQY